MSFSVSAERENLSRANTPIVTLGMILVSSDALNLLVFFSTINLKSRLRLLFTMVTPDMSIAVGLSFVFAFFALPYWIKRAREHNLLIKDAQKLPSKRVPYLSGPIIIFSIAFGVLFYIASQTFVYENGDYNILLLAAVASMLIALIIGIVDDLLGEKIGLRQYQKPILTILAALPIMAVNAGINTMVFPWGIGQVHLGNLYPLLLVPIAIVGASNAFNMLAGVNGLEAGMGIIILSVLGYLSWATGGSAAAIIAFCTVAALLVFFWYNKFPARILPGNSFTYAIGTIIAIVAILGNIEKFALFMFIPYFFEFLLKLRGRFQKESLARPVKGGIVNKYKKWYSLNHVMISFLRKIKGKAREWEVVLLLLFIELLIAAGTIYIYL